ncbi:hypothetical protein IWQ60_003634 [Tieghemiomyces parasiticus]|uniref:Uncharacterized protein n=1 Tax=Tieghemiomyces parasiticus TaxID=78921 RepID=A0A9W8A992_9FUNG|nr:hypothetical protein IWQ60_003634 [Tieghemiomyces parasiticus]
MAPRDYHRRFITSQLRDIDAYVRAVSSEAKWKKRAFSHLNRIRGRAAALYGSAAIRRATTRLDNDDQERSQDIELNLAAIQYTGDTSGRLFDNLSISEWDSVQSPGLTTNAVAEELVTTPSIQGMNNATDIARTGQGNEESVSATGDGNANNPDPAGAPETSQGDEESVSATDNGNAGNPDPADVAGTTQGDEKSVSETVGENTGNSVPAGATETSQGNGEWVSATRGGNANNPDPAEATETSQGNGEWVSATRGGNANNPDPAEATETSQGNGEWVSATRGGNANNPDPAEATGTAIAAYTTLAPAEGQSQLTYVLPSTYCAYPQFIPIFPVLESDDMSSLELWFGRYEQVAAHYNWSDCTMCQAAPQYLTPLLSLSLQYPNETPTNWPDLKSTLRLAIHGTNFIQAINRSFLHNNFIGQ